MRSGKIRVRGSKIALVQSVNAVLRLSLRRTSAARCCHPQEHESKEKKWFSHAPRFSKRRAASKKIDL
jgi:hypothetical protein